MILRNFFEDGSNGGGQVLGNQEIKSLCLEMVVTNE